VRFLIALFSIISAVFAAEGQVDFKVDGQDLSVVSKGNDGHVILLNGKITHFVPINNRADISVAHSSIKAFGLDKEQAEKLDKYLKEQFEMSLNSPTTSDLLVTSMGLADQSIKIMSQEFKEDCYKDKEEILNKKKAEEVKKVVYCECELPDELTKKIGKEKFVPSFEDSYIKDYSFFGDIEKVSLGIDTSNDNHLHGLWRNITSPELDGNDRGRTFGVNLDFELVGELAELQLSYESEIFTQLRETSPGSGLFFVDDDRKFLQDQLERNTLDLKLLKRVGDGNTFAISGFELQELTDEGNVAGPLQDGWHKLFKENNVIQYANQDFMEDQINFSIYGGVGREWLSDLGNWKCRTRLEGTAGVNVLNTDDAFLKVRGETELNSNKLFDGSEDNPWFLVSLWGEGSLETEGDNQYGLGMTVKSPIEVNDWVIEPSLGMSLQSEKEDKFFSQSQSLKLEPQSHIGITFTRKF
jgi:hypothetical protein